jgi:type IV pilus assembly protein PilB
MADTATLRMLASEYNVEYVDLDHFNTDKSMASLLSEDFARRHGVVPVGKKFGAPVIAVADPADVFMMEELKKAIDREFVTVVADREQIVAYQDSVYAVGSTDGVSGGGSDEFAVAGSEDDFNDPLANALDNALGSSIFAMAFAPDAGEDAEADASTEGGIAEGDGSDGLAVQTSSEFVADWREVADATTGGDIDGYVDGYEYSIHAGTDNGVYDGAMNGSGSISIETASESSEEDGYIAPVVSITPGAEVAADGAVDLGTESDMGTESAKIEVEPESTGRSRKGRGRHAVGAGEDQVEADTSAKELSEPVHEAALEEDHKGAAGTIAGTIAGDTRDAVQAGIEAETETETGAEAESGAASETSRRSSRRASKRVAAVEAEEGETSVSEEPESTEAAGEPDGSIVQSAKDQSVEDQLVKDQSAKGVAKTGKGETAKSETDEDASTEDTVTGRAAKGTEDAGEEGAQGFRPGSALDEALKGLAGEIPDLATGDTSSFPPLAKILVESGRVKQEDMVSVLAEHDATGQTVARVLSARELVTEADLMWGLAQEMGLEFVDLDLVQVDINLATKLSDSTCRHHNILLIGYEDGKYIVAMSNPTDVFAIDDIRSVLGRNLKTVVATRSQISRYIERAFTHGGSAEVAAQRAAVDVMATAGEEAPERETEIQSITEDAPVVRYVNLLILQALNERASDIHVEPTHDSLRIRYRIDGVLHDMQQAPLSLLSAVSTRLKVMGDLNVAEHRVPQDGRISVSVGGRTIDLRIATIPTVYGEKVVMRVLDKSEVILDLDKLGCEPDFLDKYREVFRRPYGTIFVTGPTGSGKTTTLYATLGELNSPEKNIITVEDPVELRIMGINQVQTNVKAGLTFASALRSMLRCDPDIVMVGEVRDRDTALISVEAALTGHLVLATMHTNDVSRTPMRLVEMGIEPYLVASALTAVVAQRLVRQLCVHCKEEFEPTADEMIVAGWKPDEVYAELGSDHLKMYKPVGCPACSKTGYRGREAIYELMVADDELERLITSGGSAEQIQDLAIQKGMTTLRQAGLRKVLKGETTLEEVLRVVV